LRFGGFLLMNFWPRLFLIAFLMLSFHGTQPVLAGGKTYQGSESSAHCTLWSNQRLKWPQTILGREKAECRPSAGFCALISMARLVIEFASINGKVAGWKN